MKGDFSRLSFDPRNRFSQVLELQGRVNLDADPNEQGAILLHYLRTMARDLFGPYAGPYDHAGFALEVVDGDDGHPILQVGAGRYYVHGVLCECDGCDYDDQPHFTPAEPGDSPDSGDPLLRWLASRGQADTRFWMYLDVWERHVTAIEIPHLRESALGGPDTCSRTQVVWQVRALPIDVIQARLDDDLQVLQETLADTQDADERARLQARIDALQADIALLQQHPEQACAVPLRLFERTLPALAAQPAPRKGMDTPCLTAPDAGYRGIENHLYRVEIHRGNEDGGTATFKWSRDNGSVLTRWLGCVQEEAGTRVQLADARGFSQPCTVELSDDEDDLSNRPGQLFSVKSLEAHTLMVDGAPTWNEQRRNPKVRRWDQIDAGDVKLDAGAVPIAAESNGAIWIDLEDGLQVRFAPGSQLRSGDWWSIVARVASGIEWPSDRDGNPAFEPPRGVEHRYAPLGFLGRGADGAIGVQQSCRCLVHPASTCGLLGQRNAENANGPAGAAPAVTKRARKKTTTTRRRDR